MEQKDIYFILLSTLIFIFSTCYFYYVWFMGGDRKLLKNWERIYKNSVDPNPSKFLNAIHSPLYLKCSAIFVVIFGAVVLICGIFRLLKWSLKNLQVYYFPSYFLLLSSYIPFLFGFEMAKINIVRQP